MSQTPLKKYQVYLIVLVAAIGFLFDTYELLMFPVIGADAVGELLKKPPTDDAVRSWAGRMLWIAALCGGIFGLLGGWLIDRLGRKRVMVGSIMLYSFSPVFAAFSTNLAMLVIFRCTTFIGVCVELVAAVTWLAELFQDKRTREKVIAWTLACASLGGIFVTEVYNGITAYNKTTGLPELPWIEFDKSNLQWRYTLLTGLIPGALIMLLMPFVPESFVWREKKAAGTLKRPGLGALFSQEHRRTTIVTTILSACGYAAAFGCLQLTPIAIAPNLPDIKAKEAELSQGIGDAKKAEAAATANLAKVTKAFETWKEKKGPENEADLKAAVEKAEGELKAAKAAAVDAGKKMGAFRGGEVKERRGDIQRWQELGGLLGRILLAVLIVFLPPKLLLRVFLLPGIIWFPVTYLFLVKQDYAIFAFAIFVCGLLTVAQFSYLSEFLPKVFPLELRGTGGGFATNIGGRMIGTMASTLNVEILSKMFKDSGPLEVAVGAAVIGGAVYAIAMIMSFFLPEPKH